MIITAAPANQSTILDELIKEHMLNVYRYADRLIREHNMSGRVDLGVIFQPNGGDAGATEVAPRWDGRRRVFLNAAYLTTPWLAKQVILHELGHVLVPEAGGDGHNARWEQAVRDLGGEPERYFDAYAAKAEEMV